MEIQFTKTMTPKLWNLLKSMTREELLMHIVSSDKEYHESICKSRADSQAELDALKKASEEALTKLATPLKELKFL